VRQVGYCKIGESSNFFLYQSALTILYSAKFLFLYFHWFFSTDIAVSFVFVVLKMQQNESL